MLPHDLGGRVLATVLLLATGLGACDDSQQAPFGPDLAVSSNDRDRRPFEVYTQNIYLGGDTGPLFTIDFTDIPLVIASTNVFWQEVLASNAPERAAAIVDEIADRRPHVVGLQEVLRFVLLDGGFQPIGGLDLLAAIESEIASRGLPYETEVIQAATSSTLPLAFDPEAGAISQWLNFTDRLVTLRRTDVEVTSAAQGLYAATLNLGPVELKRGWTRTSAAHDGTTYHFVNTHLEISQIAPVQAAQAEELENAVIAGLEGVTIIAGDLNSNAAGQPGDPTWTPTYGNLVDAGFVDVWEAAPHRPQDQSLTCCHPSSLTGNQDFDQRIDFVLVRSSGDEQSLWAPMRGVYRADIVGEEPTDLTESGLWPSDHAGPRRGREPAARAPLSEPLGRNRGASVGTMHPFGPFRPLSGAR